MKWLRLSERTKDLLATLARFIVILPMIGLGQQAWMFVHAIWVYHLISKDAHAITAVVT